MPSFFWGKSCTFTMLVISILGEKCQRVEREREETFRENERVKNSSFVCKV